MPGRRPSQPVDDALNLNDFGETFPVVEIEGEEVPDGAEGGGAADSNKCLGKLNSQHQYSGSDWGGDEENKTLSRKNSGRGSKKTFSSSDTEAVDPAFSAQSQAGRNSAGAQTSSKNKGISGTDSSGKGLRRTVSLSDLRNSRLGSESTHKPSAGHRKGSDCKEQNDPQGPPSESPPLPTGTATSHGTHGSAIDAGQSDGDFASDPHDSGNHSDATQQAQVSADDFVNNLISNDSEIGDLFNNVDNDDWLNRFSGNGFREFRTMCERLRGLKRLNKLPASQFRSEFIEMLYKYNDNDKDLLNDIFDFCYFNTPSGFTAGGPLCSFQALCNTDGSTFKNLKAALGTGTERDTNLHAYKQFNGSAWSTPYSFGRGPKKRPARRKKND